MAGSGLDGGHMVSHAVGGLPDSGASFVRYVHVWGRGWFLWHPGPGGGPSDGAPARVARAGRSMCVCGGWSRRRRGEHCMGVGFLVVGSVQLNRFGWTGSIS
ncbi:hypothetical protein F511_04744 [Dorcoceras hygrometricum]|uniref:Uncharacterized protein n=1 Tax=Dorcoceras hygrometricum TaxID=472368 RepID=A0A2Z7AW23_9LAMI|nr:hypothetical protein F511_04744 [Dorcoceras hygrometricum]